MVSRAKIRGKKLDADCKRARTTSHEYGLEDDRVFCLGLTDEWGEDLSDKCKNCPAHWRNSTPPTEKKS